MKRSIGRYPYPAAFLIAAALLCVMTLLGSPSTSKADDQPGRIEARINELHSKLGITPAQEEQWNKLKLIVQLSKEVWGK